MTNPTGISRAPHAHMLTCSPAAWISVTGYDSTTA